MVGSRSRAYAWIIVFFVCHAAAMATDYRLIALDDSGAGRAAALNDQGWVVGEQETADGRVQAFLWNPEDGVKLLGTLGGANSRAYSINRDGMVVGEAMDSNGVTRAFVWKLEGGMRELNLNGDTLFSAAYAVNDDGVIVGSLENQQGMHAVMWRDGQVTILPRLPGSGNIQPLDINRRGDVVGHIKTGSDEFESFGSHAFYFTDAVNARNLSSFMLISPFSGSAAVAMNKQGDAAGYTMNDASIRAFYYNRRVGITHLDDRGATYSTAFGINDHGHVVGSYIASYEADESACLWVEEALIDLNTINGRPGDWWLVQATGINNQGLIIGNGLQGDRSRAFLLMPITE